MKKWKIPAAVILAALILWFCLPLTVGVLNIGNFSGIFVCVFLLAWMFGYQKLKRKAQKKGKAKHFLLANRILAVLFGLGTVWAAVLAGLMIFGAFSVPPEGATVVVLGSQVKGTVPSLDLWARINRAAEYLAEHPDAVCIASGGQGPDEEISEAKAIRDSLIELGIAPDRILLEDQSTNTRENLIFSAQIIEEKGLDKNAAIVTDEYHEYRACRTARLAGLTPYAVSARSPLVVFPANSVRELFAVTRDLLFFWNA